MALFKQSQRECVLQVERVVDTGAGVDAGLCIP